MRTQGCETGDNPELSVVPFTMASEGSGAPPVDGVTLAVFEHRFERRAGRRTAMARRHADPIEVRGPGSGGTAGAGEQPTHFLWRDRVYAVREVLGHWRESGPWWEAVRAAPQQGVRETGVLDTTDREVWRVEASRGRCYAPGVYELSLDRTAGRWTLRGSTD
jgi:hypothetical protein